MLMTKYLEKKEGNGITESTSSPKTECLYGWKESYVRTPMKFNKKVIVDFY